MSTKEKETAKAILEAYKVVPDGDKRYVQGWLDAKADTHNINNKKED